ncbi:mechanosensitive ion channel family protein [Parafilimonas sp.]|uniref:mechanosensitive ion channel family protein n=1 Tax=Parafilimonas sp. TaxID=1969739 RepID=UPI0039E560CC
MDNITKMYENIQSLFATYGLKILGAILFFIVGLWITNIITRLLGRLMVRRGFDVSLQSFLISLLSIGLKILLLISVAGMIGIETTSFVAVIGALGLAVGLALQGSLANFAGGVLILLFKPFKVGDLIESNGQIGTVHEIQIFNTILLTPDNKTTIIANAMVSNGIITNYSKHGSIRVDLSTNVAADNDMNKVRAVALEVMNNDEKILKDPAPGVFVSKLGGYFNELSIRPYATVENYWDVYFGTLEKIQKAFAENGITAPVPSQVLISKTA